MFHASNRQEVLLHDLCERLQQAPLPPLRPETIVVPSRAMGRWLRLRLAERLGIAASLDLPVLGTFLARLAGSDPDDPFAREVLALRVFRLLGDGAGDAQLALPLRYCQDDPEQHKRWQLAERLAACFDAYQLYRPEVLAAWAAGEAGPSLPHADWQGHLWRLLLRDAGHGEIAPAAAPARRRRGDPTPALPFGGASAAAGPDPHRLRRIEALLDDEGWAAATLPPRLSLFATGPLPPPVVALLHRIAARVPVTGYLLLPTDQYFGDVQRPRNADAMDAPHALLAALGRQAREGCDVLLDSDPHGDGVTPLPCPDPGHDTALHVLQSDLLHVRQRTAGAGDPALRPWPLAADDASLRLHGCHSPLREMEVLRDQILDALEHEPGLRPADVLVLVPDIRTYAPFVQAVFGPLQDALPFQIADRSPALAQPMLATLLRVCALGRGPVTTSQVLHLLDEPALLRTFGLRPADRTACRDFLTRTRVRRWDPAASGPHSLELARARLLLGIATGPTDRLVLDLLPEADATLGRADVLGGLLDLVSALQQRWAGLGRPQTLGRLADELEQTLALFDAVSAEEREAADHVRQCARELRARADRARLREELSPAVFADLLAGMLEQFGEAAGSFAGGITFAALQPLRAVPARMLCLAGLSAEAFPRLGRAAPFDLLAAARRPGDRSVRDDDRHLFLEALLSARDRLHLTWVARSAKDDSECAPSAVVSELLEHLDRTCSGPGGRPAHETFFLQHPLQAFAGRYHTGTDPRLFTYARATPVSPVAAAPAEPGPFVADALPADGASTATTIELDDLVTFWRNPARAFCRRRLDLRLRRIDERDCDVEPFILHRLDQYQLDAAAVAARLRGDADPDALTKYRQRGLLPADGLAAPAFVGIDLNSAVMQARVGAPPRPEHATALGADFVVRGNLPMGPDGPIHFRPAKVGGKDQLRAWVHHLLWHAAAEQGAGPPVGDGRSRVLGTKESCWIERPGLPGDALRWLADLVAGYRLGLTRPLPFLEKSSHAWAKARHEDKDAAAAARRVWVPRQQSDNTHAPPGDSEDVDVQLCWRDQDVLAMAAFAAWAERIWLPLLGLLRPDD